MQAAVIVQFWIIFYNKRYNIVFQALFKKDQPPYTPIPVLKRVNTCLLYTSDAADDLLCVDSGGRRIIKKKHIWRGRRLERDGI